MSKITPEEIKRVAALANLGLAEEEIAGFATELDKIVGFVEQLQSVDTSGVEQTDQVTGLKDVAREDKVAESLKYDDLKANAPDWEDGYYKVRRVL